MTACISPNEVLGVILWVQNFVHCSILFLGAVVVVTLVLGIFVIEESKRLAPIFATALLALIGVSFIYATLYLVEDLFIMYCPYLLT